MAVENLRLDRSREIIVSTLNCIVFAVCGVLDKVLCPVFRFLDWQVDRNATPCHCAPHPSSASLGDGGSVYHALDFWNGPSHTLYERHNKWGSGRSPRIGELVGRRKSRSGRKAAAVAPSNAGPGVAVAKKKSSTRLRPTCWSDCACTTCTAWMAKDSLLYVHADCKGVW